MLLDQNMDPRFRGDDYGVGRLRGDDMAHDSRPDPAPNPAGAVGEVTLPGGCGANHALIPAACRRQPDSARK